MAITNEVSTALPAHKADLLIEFSLIHAPHPRSGPTSHSPGRGRARDLRDMVAELLAELEAAVDDEA